MLVIEQHPHEAVDVLRDRVEAGGAIATCRLMGALGDCVALADQNTSPPISTPGYTTSLS